tara:strand:+ start:421 stop:597 length:177 start_codon:yes stop_codon:yes gene_type:complete
MSNPDPTKPSPNGEKFKPQNVQDPVSTVEPPTANADTPADTDGQDIPRGSEPDVKPRG